MATAELPRPGVEIIQEFRAASPTVLRPTLVPCIVGVAKEIVEVTTDDGLLNENALQGEYEQLPRVISQTSFPSPRDNIAEVDVEEGTIRASAERCGSSSVTRASRSSSRTTTPPGRPSARTTSSPPLASISTA